MSGNSGQLNCRWII